MLRLDSIHNGTFAGEVLGEAACHFLDCTCGRDI
jgi:hypothetical protein